MRDPAILPLPTNKDKGVFMKHLILTTVILLLTNSIFAAVEYNCTHQDKTIGFTIDQDGQTISFHDVDYLGYAQIIVDHKFPSQLADKVLTFEYDWYYTAFYEIKFKQPISQHKYMRAVNMVLTFDDSDWAFEDDIEFQCHTTNI